MLLTSVLVCMQNSSTDQYASRSKLMNAALLATFSVSMIISIGFLFCHSLLEDWELRDFSQLPGLLYESENDAPAKELEVELSWKCLEMDGTNPEKEPTTFLCSLGGAELLMFLERGLPWGEPVSGDRRAGREEDAPDVL